MTTTMTEAEYDALPVINTISGALQQGLRPGEFRLRGWSYDDFLGDPRLHPGADFWSYDDFLGDPRLHPGADFDIQVSPIAVTAGPEPAGPPDDAAAHYAAVHKALTTPPSAKRTTETGDGIIVIEDEACGLRLTLTIDLTGYEPAPFDFAASTLGSRPGVQALVKRLRDVAWREISTRIP